MKKIVEELNTDRLLLKRTTEQDAEVIFKVFNAPKFIQYVGDRNLKKEMDAKRYILSHMNPQWERQGFGSYTIIRKDNHHKMGICGLFDREGVEGVDLGFGLIPKSEGHGYALEAAQMVVHTAFTQLGLTDLKAITSKMNFGSQRLLQKLGFTLVKPVTLPNSTEEILLFSIFK